MSANSIQDAVLHMKQATVYTACWLSTRLLEISFNRCISITTLSNKQYYLDTIHSFSEYWPRDNAITMQAGNIICR